MFICALAPLFTWSVFRIWETVRESFLPPIHSQNNPHRPDLDRDQSQESGLDIDDVCGKVPKDLSVWPHPSDVSTQTGEKGPVKVFTVDLVMKTDMSWVKEIKWYFQHNSCIPHERHTLFTWGVTFASSLHCLGSWIQELETRIRPRHGRARQTS